MKKTVFFTILLIAISTNSHGSIWSQSTISSEEIKASIDTVASENMNDRINKIENIGARLYRLNTDNCIYEVRIQNKNNNSDLAGYVKFEGVVNSKKCK